MNTTTVVVYDLSHPALANVIKKAFSGTQIKATVWSAASQVKNVDVALVHDSDVADQAHLAENLCVGPNGVIIRYTTGRPSTLTDASRGVYWIQRGLDTQKAITKSEAQEVIAWARARNSKKNCLIPRMLQLPASMMFLPSLAILCQGFLAVHAVGDATNTYRVCRKALDAMGWPTDGRSRLDSAETPTNVCTNAWWTAPFEKTSLREEVTAEMKDRQIAKKSAKQVQALVSAILGDMHIEPKLVADTYLELAKVLRP